MLVHTKFDFQRAARNLHFILNNKKTRAEAINFIEEFLKDNFDVYLRDAKETLSEDMANHLDLLNKCNELKLDNAKLFNRYQQLELKYESACQELEQETFNGE